MLSLYIHIYIFCVVVIKEIFGRIRIILKIGFKILSLRVIGLTELEPHHQMYFNVMPRATFLWSCELQLCRGFSGRILTCADRVQKSLKRRYLLYSFVRNKATNMALSDNQADCDRSDIRNYLETYYHMGGYLLGGVPKTLFFHTHIFTVSIVCMRLCNKIMKVKIRNIPRYKGDCV